MTPKKKDKWKGYSAQKVKRIHGKIDRIRDHLRILKIDVTRNSINLDLTYNEIFEGVEALYGELDLHNLMQDNQRRYRIHKEKVRESGER